VFGRIYAIYPSLRTFVCSSAVLSLLAIIEMHVKFVASPTSSRLPCHLINADTRESTMNISGESVDMISLVYLIVYIDPLVSNFL
jgi:hypothetical protein